MHNPKSVLENEMHKLLWVFEIQANHLILARQPDLVTDNNKKRTYQIVDFGILAAHRLKLKESEKRDKYLDLVRELKKTMEHEGDNDTNCNWDTWNNSQRIGKTTEKLGNESGDHTDYNML